MTPKHFLLALVLAVAGQLLVTVAHAESRFALVIGNSAYSDVGFLPNAVSDADLIGQSLEAMGFETLVLKDVDEDSFGLAIDDLTARAATADVIAFYFAGHGIQVEGENYLIPVDAELSTPGAVARETISLDAIIDALKPTPIAMIFLDACRNNPWTDRLVKRSVSTGRSATCAAGFLWCKPRATC